MYACSLHQSLIYMKMYKPCAWVLPACMLKHRRITVIIFDAGNFAVNQGFSLFVVQFIRFYCL